MVKIYCHRCLLSFNCHSRLVLHLKKEKKCKITNDKYDEKYEKQLMTHIDANYIDFEIDVGKHIIKLGDGSIGYKCNLCECHGTDKYDMKRHLMQSCPHNKYTLNDDLLKLINHAQDPTQWLLENKNEIIKPHLKLKNKILTHPLSQRNKIITQTDEETYNDINENDLRELYSNYINVELVKNNNQKCIFRCKICQIPYDHKDEIYDHISQNQDHIDKILQQSESYLSEDDSNQFNQLFNKGNDWQKVEQKVNDIIGQKLNAIKEELKQGINKTNIFNNNHAHFEFHLHDNGNALKIMEEREGSFDKALTFVKDCALSQLSGDIRLIEKLYLDKDQPAIFYIDKNKKKLVYIDKDGKNNLDTNGLIGRKLASNLQNGYLCGINYLINKNLDEKRCPLKFLGDYDVQMWNSHIYELRDVKYQKKLISNSDIPVKPLTF
jgi:hypothetical protein